MIVPGIHPTAVIGDPPQHRDWTLEMAYHYPVIRPSARINAHCTVDSGMYEPTYVGERTLLMASVHVGHDSQIGDDCEIAPMTSIAGHVKIGNRVRIGMGVVIRSFVEIGEGARLGMGAVVTKNVPAGETWVGNPARKLRGAATGEILTDSEVEGWDAFGEAAR